MADRKRFEVHADPAVPTPSEPRSRFRANPTSVPSADEPPPLATGGHSPAEAPNARGTQTAGSQGRFRIDSTVEGQGQPADPSARGQPVGSVRQESAEATVSRLKSTWDSDVARAVAARRDAAAHRESAQQRLRAATEEARRLASQGRAELSSRLASDTQTVAVLRERISRISRTAARPSVTSADWRGFASTTIQDVTGLVSDAEAASRSLTADGGRWRIHTPWWRRALTALGLFALAAAIVATSAIGFVGSQFVLGAASVLSALVLMSALVLTPQRPTA